MQPVRHAMRVVVAVAIYCMLVPAIPREGTWLGLRPKARSASPWWDSIRSPQPHGRAPRPYCPISAICMTQLIAADKHGQLSKEGLVTDWRANATGDVVTLTIRPEVKFHNGELLTAADVKFSFETWKEQTGGSPSLTGAAMRGILKRIDMVNDQQVQVHLHSPNAIFPHLLSWVEGDLGILPKRYFEALPGQTFEEKRNAFVKQPIGTGSWKFVSRTVGTSIRIRC